MPEDLFEKERANTAIIARAIAFAEKAHQGQKRKGTELPYIVHPMEVWTILRSNGCSVPVQIAGLLHDTLEDTPTEPEDIEAVFGKEILALVQTESEDKSKSWKERKTHTIEEMTHDSRETMQVCCADKLSNCRAQFYDYQQMGDLLFRRFNAPKEDQAWYYKGIVNALKPLENMQMYQELKTLVTALYGAMN